MSSDIVDLMRRRVSFPRLEEPAPTSDVREKIYRAALRAPDHKILRPYRYLCIEGDARHRLGELFCSASETDAEPLTEAQKTKYRSMPLRAPLIIVAVSANVEHPKVPIHEQQISCGVGVGYMLLALQAEGFGGMWRTGALAENDAVKVGLGIAKHETLVGFLYVGTPSGQPKNIVEPDIDHYFQAWPNA